MSSEDVEFKIDAWTPETLPQARLGLYLVELAKLYGEQENVRFVKLRKGSAVLVSKITDSARPKVERRLSEIGLGTAPKDVLDAYRRIDDLLAADNATALVRGLEFGRVLQFPGRQRVRAPDYGLVREDGAIEGEIIRIGGKDESIHVTLCDGETIHGSIETTRDMARQLGRLMFGPTVRLWGRGYWRRDGDGEWSLERFVVSNFEEVATPLFLSMNALQAVEGSRWSGQSDPVSVLLDDRYGDGATGGS